MFVRRLSVEENRFPLLISSLLRNLLAIDADIVCFLYIRIGFPSVRRPSVEEDRFPVLISSLLRNLLSIGVDIVACFL